MALANSKEEKINASKAIINNILSQVTTPNARVDSSQLVLPREISKPFIRLFNVGMTTGGKIKSDEITAEEGLYITMQNGEKIILENTNGNSVEIEQIDETNFKVIHKTLFGSYSPIQVQSGYSGNHGVIFYTVGSVTAEFNNSLLQSLKPKRNSEKNNFGKIDRLTLGVGARTISNRRALAKKSVSVTPINKKK
jgi:hypothetical protein